MPEGDTLWRTAAALRPRLVGKTVVNVEPSRLGRLKGRRVDAVDANGKHLLVRFDNDLVLHSHMRMTGSWHIYAPGQRWQKPARLASAVLAFDDVVAVLFSAPVVELTRDAQEKVGHLGPDILAEDFAAADAVSLARRSDRVELGDALLDQRVCAGIGNIYKCESMWIHRANPWRLTVEISDDELAEIYETARRLMRQSIAGSRLGGRRAVHARAHRPCPRCATPIAVRAQGALGRLTYYCQRCQGGPPGTRPSASSGAHKRAATKESHA
ncbi:MAG TPA: DNA-formamidopyrimidine glycosylase family protein [Candidatus Dormibacteraeota bacterium]|nr:DNA-formamidopyrimidine glycosylase family protein [Candidatus Dormibacteraeota bacterium]